MEEKKLLVSASPHIVDGSSTRGLMIHVIIALVPAMIASAIIFGARALAVVAVTVAACVLFEALFNILMKRPQTVSDCSAVVTGIILAFNLPPTIPLWTAVVGAFVAIVLVKQLFGGIGMNFANPALVGRIALFLGFAAHMTNYAVPAGALDGMASATPLVLGAEQSGVSMLRTLVLGTHPGMLGETCALMLVLGGVYLIATGTISPAIPVTYLATVAVMSLLLGQDVVLQLLSGGLLLGAFFMATDYVTSPFTLKGKIVFGVGLGVITCAIRFYSNMNEGVSFALLLMNLLVPYINDLTRQKPLGGGKAK